MRTTVILNSKGGVGKTVTAATLARCLARDHGKTVLVIDADFSGNCSQYFGVEADDGNSTWALLTGNGEPYWHHFITPTEEHENLFVVPADSTLANADMPDRRISVTAIKDLREAIEEDNGLDICLIDCHPYLGRTTQAALLAADDVIIPIRLDTFSTSGMKELLQQVENMRRLNSKLRVAGILATQYLGSDVEKDAHKWLKEESGLPVFRTRVRMSTPVIESVSKHQSIYKSSPNSGAAIDYRCVALEYLRGGGEHV